MHVWNLVEHREIPWDGAQPHRRRIVSLVCLPAANGNGTSNNNNKNAGAENAGVRFVSLDQEGRSVLWATAPGTAIRQTRNSS